MRTYVVFYLLFMSSEQSNVKSVFITELSKIGMPKLLPTLIG